MPVLKNLLGLLSPMGDQFFDVYIYGKYEGIQFKVVVENFTEQITTIYIQNIIE